MSYPDRLKPSDKIETDFEYLVIHIIRLHELDSLGGLDSEEADELRDAMDGPWYKLGDAEHRALGNISEELYKMRGE